MQSYQDNQKREGDEHCSIEKSGSKKSVSNYQDYQETSQGKKRAQ